MQKETRGRLHDGQIASPTQWIEQTPGDSGGQRSLACYSPWGHKESDITQQLNNNNTQMQLTNKYCQISCKIVRPGINKLSNSMTYDSFYRNITLDLKHLLKEQISNSVSATNQHNINYVYRATIYMTSVGKVMSLLFHMLSRFVISFLPRSKHLLISWVQSLSTMILEPKKIKSVTASTFTLSICNEVMGQDAMILVF